MKKSPIMKSALMLLTAAALLPALISPATAALFTPEAKLIPSGPTFIIVFGVAVAVSGDTAVIGDVTRGAAHVFVRSGGIWSQRQKLTASDGWFGDSFGHSVALSDDLMVIGAFADDDAGIFSGSAYVFVRSGGIWTQQQKLTASDAATWDSFGYSVALSGGDTIVVGAPSLAFLGKRVRRMCLCGAGAFGPSNKSSSPAMRRQRTSSARPSRSAATQS